MIIPVILSGGSGTRLWPMSRTTKPKQLLALTNDQTMLQLTVQRTAGRPGFTSPIIVGNALHAAEIEQQLSAIGVSDADLILEPVARNTGPAIALAALAADPSALLLVMPSDHIIADVDALLMAITAAEPLCRQGWFVTFGITPDAPETGYGYIRRGEEIGPGVYKVDSFVEKPDVETARAYLATETYSWNGGIFLFTAAAFLGALSELEPDMFAATTEAMASARREDNRIYPAIEPFSAAPSESVDYAIMERASQIAVVPVEMGWSDVGSWDALHTIAPRDSDDNSHQGEIVAIDTSGCFLKSDGPLIAAVGVRDLIVIATKDAVLVLPRGSSQDVKRAIEELKRGNHAALHQFQ